MVEPWEILAERRMKEVGKILLVGSGKGGVGKSLIAAGLAEALKARGFRTGLFDLDIHGPSVPEILGVEKIELRGTREGLEPPSINGVKAMSVGFLVGKSPVPLRGAAKSEVVEDLIANTNWGHLDYLVVDLPPGTGEEVVDSLRVFRRFPHGFIVVATPSVLALSVVERLLRLLIDERISIEGLVANMATLPGGAPHPGLPVIEEFSKKQHIRLLAKIPFDLTLEEVLMKKAPLSDAKAFWESILELSETISAETSAHPG